MGQVQSKMCGISSVVKTTNQILEWFITELDVKNEYVDEDEIEISPMEEYIDMVKKWYNIRDNSTIDKYFDYKQYILDEYENEKLIIVYVNPVKSEAEEDFIELKNIDDFYDGWNGRTSEFFQKGEIKDFYIIWNIYYVSKSDSDDE